MQRYGACVKTFMPWLLGLYHHTELVGVAGLRSRR
ncbi:MAG: thermostable hemolysin [Cellvibrionales bacterium]|nr:thermostable hemolysin [Cellvibrionales bacterium]